MDRRRVVRAAALVVIGLLTVAAFTVELPLLVLSPGSALPVAARVSFESRAEDEVTGRLLLTTVLISQPTAVDAARAGLDDEQEVVDRTRVIPEGVDAREYFDAQREVFTEAGQVAAAVGLRVAGLDVTVSGEGAEVIAVGRAAPAAGELRPGDVITAVDGEPVGLAAELITALGEHGAGDTVTLTVRRSGRTLEPQVTLDQIDPTGAAGLGVAVRTVERQVDLPFEVGVDSGQIGGPSAGLMIALAVYDLADPGDLTDGRVIAGTGTIDPSGNVGPVGGVAQKVAGALDAGAEVFLAPPAEVAEARSAADGELVVLEVTTIEEAIAKLDAAG